MVGQIFGHASFRDAQMVGELGLDGFSTAAAGTSAEEIPDGDAEGLTVLDVVVAG